MFSSPYGSWKVGVEATYKEVWRGKFSHHGTYGNKSDYR